MWDPGGGTIAWLWYECKENLSHKSVTHWQLISTIEHFLPKAVSGTLYTLLNLDFNSSDNSDNFKSMKIGK
jgi:hypothetical protein